MAKRPVLGVPEEYLDKIQQQMVGFNNKFVPYYQPQTRMEKGACHQGVKRSEPSLYHSDRCYFVGRMGYGYSNYSE